MPLVSRLLPLTALLVTSAARAQDTVHVWVKAFIPSIHPTNPGYIVPVPGAPGKFMLEEPTPSPTSVVQGGLCALTDHRGFDQRPTAPARITTELLLVVSSSGAKIAAVGGRPTMRADASHRVLCRNGQQIGAAQTASMSSMSVGTPAFADGMAQVVIQGAADYPFLPSPGIDYAGDFTYTRASRTLRFRGSVGVFPAFEAYAQLGAGPVQTLFRIPPGNGTTVWSLVELGTGLKQRAIDVSVVLPAAAVAQGGTAPPTLSAPDSINRAVWTANGLERTWTDTNHANLVLLGVANRIARTKGAALSPSEASKLAAQFRRANDEAARCRPTNGAGVLEPRRIAECVLAASRGLPKAYWPAVADEVGAFTNETRAVTPDVLVGHDPVRAVGDFERYGAEQLSAAWRRARTSNGAARVYAAFEPVLHASASMATGQILARNPRLRSAVTVAGVVGAAVQSGRVPQADALEQSAAQFMTARLGTLTRGGPAAVPDPLTPSAQDLGGEHAAVYLAAEMARLTGNEKLGETISTVGTVGLTLRALYAGGGSGAALAGIAGQMATLSTGVGAFVAVAGLFNQGKDPNRAELAAIRRQLKQMQQEMRDGFRRVDVRLDSLMTLTVDGFSRMEALAAQHSTENAANFDAVKRDLSVIQQQVSDVQSALQTIARRLDEADARRSVSQCSGWRRQNPGQPLSYAAWANCLSDLKTAAGNVVDDDLTALSDTATGTFTKTILRALDRPSAQDSALAYPLLAAAASRFGARSLGGPRVAPDRWATWARHYLTLLNDWPEHAVARSTDDLNRMYAEGESVRLALRALTRDGGAPDAIFFDRLLSYYHARATAMQRGIDTVVMERERSLRGVDLLRAKRPPWLAVQSGSAPQQMILNSVPVTLPPAVLTQLPPDILDSWRLGEDVQFTATYGSNLQPPVDVDCTYMKYGNGTPTLQPSAPADGSHRQCVQFTRIRHVRPSLTVSVRRGSLELLQLSATATSGLEIRRERWSGRAFHGHEGKYAKFRGYLSGTTDDAAIQQIGMQHLLSSPLRMSRTVDSAQLATRVDSLRASQAASLRTALQEIASTFQQRQMPRSSAGGVPAARVDELWRLAQELRAAKLLVVAYLHLALPQSMALDRHKLRSHSVGVDGALDDMMLFLPENPLDSVWEQNAFVTRSDAWRRVIMSVITTADAVEDSPFVTAVLSDLQLATSLQRARSGEAILINAVP